MKFSALNIGDKFSFTAGQKVWYATIYERQACRRKNELADMEANENIVYECNGNVKTQRGVVCSKDCVQYGSSIVFRFKFSGKTTNYKDGNIDDYDVKLHPHE